MTTKYILLIADIHANEVALAQVIRDVHNRYPAVWPFGVWFLGDLFGRGPAPIRTWLRMQDLPVEVTVIGNHDRGLIGLETNIQIGEHSDGLYEPDDWEILLKQREELVKEYLLEVDANNKLIGGPLFEALVRWPLLNSPYPGVYLAHGGIEKHVTADSAPRTFLNSLVWGYVTESVDAQGTIDAIRHFYARVAGLPGVEIKDASPQPPLLVVVGHYHRRTLYQSRGSGEWESAIRLHEPYRLHAAPEHPVLLSPGSVGFPRESADRDASYAVLELQDDVPVSVTFHTVRFDREAVMAAMEKQAYPAATIARLRLPDDVATSPSVSRSLSTYEG